MSYARKLGLSAEEEFALKERAYIFAAEYHNNLNAHIMDRLEQEQLLTPFYRTILR